MAKASDLLGKSGISGPSPTGAKPLIAPPSPIPGTHQKHPKGVPQKTKGAPDSHAKGGAGGAGGRPKV